MGQTIPWLKYAPTSEQEVVVLFALLLPHLPQRFQLEEVHEEFPDCLASRLNEDGTRSDVRIEFELYASHFINHRHDPTLCDLIVCWEDDVTGDRGLPERLVLRDFVGKASPSVIALPLTPKYEARVWGRKTFLAKCPDILRQPQIDLLQCAEQHGEVIWGKGAKYPSWTFAVPLESGERCVLFGVYANGKIWLYASPALPAEQERRYKQCLKSAPELNAALASGKAWFEVRIQEDGVLQALRAAVHALRP